MTSPYLIVDAHQDLAYNALSLGRDPRRAVQQARTLEPEKPVGGVVTVGLPEFLAGNVRVVFGTVYVSPVMFSGFGEEGTITGAKVLHDAIERAGVPIREIWSGDRLTLGREVTAQVFHPPQRGSCTTRISMLCVSSR